MLVLYLIFQMTIVYSQDITAQLKVTPHSEHLPWGQGYKVDLRHCYYYMYDWVASSSEHAEEIATLHWTERQTDKTNIIKFI